MRRIYGVGPRSIRYVVPLRVGSTYTLKLRLDDFWCPKSKEFNVELKPGKHGVRAEFAGNKSQHRNSGSEAVPFMPFWAGKVKFELAQFQIGKRG